MPIKGSLQVGGMFKSQPNILGGSMIWSACQGSVDTSRGLGCKEKGFESWQEGLQDKLEGLIVSGGPGSTEYRNKLPRGIQPAVPLPCFILYFSYCWVVEEQPNNRFQ